jgi:dihydrofolate reductase
MKVVMIANLSANGKVLLADNPSTQEAPQEALGYFVEQANLKGNLILGRKTYEVMQQFPGGLKAFFPNVEIVLMSHSKISVEGFTVVNNPEEAINYLSEKGFKEIIVGGGVQVYNEFLDRELVTDVFFNFIPMIVGNGGIIGNSEELNTKFKIIDNKLLTKDIAQIHLVKI